MDPYLILKFVHVAMAILWVGGATILTLLVAVLLSRGDDEATMTGLSYVAQLGNRLFAPAGLLAIASGLTLGWLGGWFWAAWTVLAIAIVTCTFLLGALVLGPSSEAAVRTWRGGDLAAAMAHGRRVLRLAAIDLGAQWAIISLMVLKPGWTDVTLGVPAALVLGGLLAALRRPSAAAGSRTAQQA